MEKMKNSGIEWIGDIPEGWKVSRIKYIADIRSENGVFNPEINQYIGLENIKSYSNEIITTGTEYQISFQSKCFKNDVMFSRLRPYLAKVLISPFDGFCTGELLQFYNFSGDKKYLYYLLLNPVFIDIVNASTYGAKMPRANTDFILNQYFPLPPPETQKRIADFLDEKCVKIDGLKNDIQKQIETLEQYKKSVITEAVTKGINPNAKMKDSGIDDVGQIPESWEEKKIKFLFDLVNDQNHLPMDKVQLLSLYTELGVFPHGEQEERGNKAVTVEGYKKVKKNDLVVNIILAWMGAMGISNYDGVTSPAYDIYRPKSENANPKYYHYLFRTPWFAGECDKYGRGIMRMRWRTYSQEFMNIKIPYPSVEEQKQIADYLDEKCSSIDSIISTKKHQLEKLEEYKKSLIFEYVTGKREVSCEFPSETSEKKGI